MLTIDPHLTDLMDIVHRETALTPAQLEQMIAAATHPALLLVKTPFSMMQGAPGCWLGGRPTLPPDIDWPWVTRGDDQTPLYPMHFIGQISLAQLPSGDDAPDMPRTGTLFFFFDYLDHLEGAPGTTRVIHASEDVLNHPERAMPGFPGDWEDHDPGMCWFDEPKQFKRWPVTFHTYTAVQSELFPQRAFYEAVIDTVIATSDTLRDRAMQSDPGLGSDAGPGARRKEPARHTLFEYEGMRDRDLMRQGMVPLLQVELDYDLGFDYSTNLVFYIPPDALAAGDFSRAVAYTLV